MFGIFGIATVVAMVFGTGWCAHDVAEHGAKIPGVEIPAVLGK